MRFKLCSILFTLALSLFARNGTALSPTGPILPASNTTQINNGIMMAPLKDLAYAHLSSDEKLDLYRPLGVGPFPTVIYVHGGGWRKKDTDKSYPADNGIVARLLSEGYAVASVNYRLSEEAVFPAAIQDVKTAVRWLRANAAEYDLDPNKFGAWGESAGGNLVSLLGTSCRSLGILKNSILHSYQKGDPIIDLEGLGLGSPSVSSCVEAVVDFYGPTDFAQMDQENADNRSCPPSNHDDAGSAESQYIGGALQKNLATVEEANPVTYIDGNEPPFFIEHGTADCTVPYQQSQLLYDALRPVLDANKLTLTYLTGAQHEDPAFTVSSNLDLVINFLDTYLK